MPPFTVYKAANTDKDQISFQNCCTYGKDGIQTKGYDCVVIGIVLKTGCTVGRAPGLGEFDLNFPSCCEAAQLVLQNSRQTIHNLAGCVTSKSRSTQDRDRRSHPVIRNSQIYFEKGYFLSSYTQRFFAECAWCHQKDEYTHCNCDPLTSEKKHTIFLRNTFNDISELTFVAHLSLISRPYTDSNSCRFAANPGLRMGRRLRLVPFAPKDAPSGITTARKKSSPKKSCFGLKFNRMGGGPHSFIRGSQTAWHSSRDLLQAFLVAVNHQSSACTSLQVNECHFLGCWEIAISVMMMTRFDIKNWMISHGFSSFQTTGNLR